MKNNPKSKTKTIKLDPKTHKLLRMYAVENDLKLGEAVRGLLDKFTKKSKNRIVAKKSI